MSLLYFCLPIYSLLSRSAGPPTAAGGSVRGGESKTLPESAGGRRGGRRPGPGGGHSGPPWGGDPEEAGEVAQSPGRSGRGSRPQDPERVRGPRRGRKERWQLPSAESHLALGRRRCPSDQTLGVSRGGGTLVSALGWSPAERPAHGPGECRGVGAMGVSPSCLLRRPGPHSKGNTVRQNLFSRRWPTSNWIKNKQKKPFQEIL